MFAEYVAPEKNKPNSIYSERHASWETERENRQQQQPLFLSMKPSFIPGSLQAVRGALQPTVSVLKQKTQMNKLTVFCLQVRRIGKSQKQRVQGYEICFKIIFQTLFQPTVELHKKENEAKVK